MSSSGSSRDRSGQSRDKSLSFDSSKKDAKKTEDHYKQRKFFKSWVFKSNLENWHTLQVILTDPTGEMMLLAEMVVTASTKSTTNGDENNK